MKTGSRKWFWVSGCVVAGAAVIAAGIWIWGPETSGKPMSQTETVSNETAVYTQDTETGSGAETAFDQDVSVLIFRDGKIQPASELDPSDRMSGNLSFTYGDGVLVFQLSLDDENVSGTAVPLPGQNPYYEGDVVLFIPEALPEGYSLMSCRIETLANSASLLPDNLDYEGHTVLALGIREDESQDDMYALEHSYITLMEQ